MNALKVAEKNKLDRVTGELYQSLFGELKPDSLMSYEIDLYFERAEDYHCLVDAKKLIELLKGGTMGRKSYTALEQELKDAKKELQKVTKELEDHKKKSEVTINIADMEEQVLKLEKHKISHRAEVAYYKALINEFCPTEVVEILDREGYIG